MMLKRFMIVLLFSAVTAGCATTELSKLEGARFALDKTNYTEAITKATAALAADPTNIEAARVLASAYLGRSGIDFLDLAEGVVDLANTNNNNFQDIAAVLPSTATLSDLRSAITTLESLTGIDAASITDEGLADAAFDLAIMQIVEQFALGIYGADYFGTLDTSGITDAQAATAQDDMIAWDNRLIASGLSSTEDFIIEIRRSYCVLERQSASDGFTADEYRQMVECQLSSSPPGACSTYDPTTAATTTCANSDTTL